MPITTERPEAAKPALTTTVAKEYVHRASLSEVFLTDWDRTGSDAFVVTAQWPRSHSFYPSEQGLHDPLLLVETVRQSFLLLTHVAYKVPFGHQLSWHRMQYSINPQAMRIESSPCEVELHVTVSDIRYHRSVPTQVSMHFDVVRDGSLLAVASTRFGCHSPMVYERLRAGRGDKRIFEKALAAPQAVSRYTVGRQRSQDIVLSPTPERWRWQLRVDTSHPVLFDHPLDHVPGMLLMESVRQAGHALQPSLSPVIPTSMDINFSRYVELDEPCWIEAEELSGKGSRGRRAVRVNALQAGSFAFTASAEMTDVSSV